MKKKLCTVALAAAAVLAVTGCSGGNNAESSTAPKETQGAASAAPKSADLRVYWWGSQVRHDATMKVLDLYKTKNPHITFEPEYQGFDGYYQKLTLQAASNNMPDVMQFYVGAGDTDQFMTKNLVAPLDELAAKKILDLSDVSESIVSTGKLNGKLYGVPLGVNAKAMVVDTEAYAKAGLAVPENGYISWETLAADLEKLKAVTGAYGADELMDVNFMMPYYMRQIGQIQYAAGTGIGFDQKAYVDYYTMKKKFMENKSMVPLDVALTIKSPEETMLVKGQSAISVIYTNQYPGIVKAAGRELKLIPLPGPNASKAMDVRPGNHFVIAENAKNKEEAAKFISFFINDVESNKLLNAERGMPIAAKVRDALKAGFTPEQKIVADYIDKVAANSSPMDPAAPAGSAEIEKLMKDLEQQILFGKITPEKAYEQLKKDAAAIVAKSKG
jgi:multiple sugar transport system substrate-binding protein